MPNTGFSSVQFSRSVMSNPLRPHESQHARPPCPSPTPGVHSNSCPLSRWCHPTISSSVVPSSSCPSSLPASGSFPMSQLFAWGGPSTGVSASASVLSMNTQDGSPLGWTGWISSQSKGLLQHNSLKASIFRCSAFFIVQLSHPYMTTGKMLYKYLPAHSKFKFCFSKLFVFVFVFWVFSIHGWFHPQMQKPQIQGATVWSQSPRFISLGSPSALS